MSSAIYGSGRSSVSPLSATVNSSGGNFTTAVGSWYFWLQARNAIGYNLVSTPTNVVITANSVLNLTIPADAYRSGEFWEYFYISGSKINDPNTSCIIAVIPALNNLQQPINFPITIQLNYDSQLALNASVTNINNLPVKVTNGTLSEVSSLGYIYKYNEFSTKTPDNVTILPTGIDTDINSNTPIPGAWEIFKDGFNINILDATGPLGCNQYITDSTDTSRITELSYNANGSAGFFRTFWIVNTNQENIPQSTQVGMAVYLNGVDVSSSVRGLFKIKFLGYSNILTGVIDTIGSDGINPMPGLNTLYPYDPNKTDLQLPKDLPVNYAYVYQIYPEFSNNQVNLSIPNGSNLYILPYLYALQGTYNPIGNLLGDFITNDYAKRRALPRQGLSLTVGSGSGIVKSYQFNTAPQINVFGLSANTGNQLLVIDGNGSVYISALPSSTEAIRAIISTEAAFTNPLASNSITGDNNSDFTITFNHPASLLSNNGINTANIDGTYPDVIAGTNAIFNPSAVRVYIYNQSTGVYYYKDFALDYTSITQTVTANPSTMTVTTSVPNNTGFFKLSNLLASCPNFNCNYIVTVGYYYDGNTVSKIEHSSRDTFTVVPELGSSFLQSITELPRLRTKIRDLSTLRELDPVNWDYVLVQEGAENLPSIYTYDSSNSNADDGLSNIRLNNSQVTGAYRLLTRTGSNLFFQDYNTSVPPDNSIGSPNDWVIYSTGNVWQKQQNNTWFNVITFAQTYELNQFITSTVAFSSFLQISNNLSDVPNKPAARDNLGLGNSAVLNAPVSGDAQVYELVLGSDTRLGNASELLGYTINGTPTEGTSPVYNSLTDQFDLKVVSQVKPFTGGSIAVDSNSITSTAANINETSVPEGSSWPLYTYNWYMSTSTNFDASSGNLISGASSNTLSLTGLTSNTTYFVRRVSIDALGNKVATPEINFTTLT